MSLILPINLDELLRGSGVESARVEFKATWDERTTGFQVIKTIGAFANDLQHLNGGYIVIGVEEEGGRAVMPPKGLDEATLERASRWIRGQCRRIDPVYQPVLSPEVVEGRAVLVIWVPGSESRPHRVPVDEKKREKSEKRYFVRLGSESVDAEANGLLLPLLQLTARVPFDDRVARDARLEDLREMKVREFLRDIQSGLLEESRTKELYRKLRIAAPVNGHDAPRHIGLLMFSDDPETWFSGVRIEVVRFDAKTLDERVFRGGLHEQLRGALRDLDALIGMYTEKQPTVPYARTWFRYPPLAIREALVNALCHRSYEATPEPIKIHIHTDRIEIISYPGPVVAITAAHLKLREPLPLVPARNRRVTEMMKELRLAEGHGTGLPKMYQAMRDNGSRDPLFDFDTDRTYFRVTLFAHQ